MRVSRVAVVGAALALGTALSVVPLQVAGAQPPGTSVLVPSNGATLSGSTYLDASASDASSVEFLLFGGTYGYSAPVVCTATPTSYGWLCSWDTTTVLNGTYALVSEASGAGGNAFDKVDITVNNPPPSSTIVLPQSGATLDSAQGYVLDAVASPGVTQVTFYIGVVGIVNSVAATPTIYGWLYVFPGTGPQCGFSSPICATHSFPAELQTVASYAGGRSGVGSPINVTVIVYTPPGT